MWCTLSHTKTLLCEDPLWIWLIPAISCWPIGGHWQYFCYVVRIVNGAPKEPYITPQRYPFCRIEEFVKNASEILHPQIGMGIINFDTTFLEIPKKGSKIEEFFFKIEEFEMALEINDFCDFGRKWWLRLTPQMVCYWFVLCNFEFFTFSRNYCSSKYFGQFQIVHYFFPRILFGFFEILDIGKSSDVRMIYHHI